MRTATARLCGTTLVAVTITSALVGCSEPTPSSNASTWTATMSPMTSVAPPSDASATPPTAQPRLAPNPVQLADDLVADEQALRDPSSSEAALISAARRQQV